MTCLREVVLAHGPTTSNAADSELAKLKLDCQNFQSKLNTFLEESAEEAEKRRKKVQCQLLDICRRQEAVKEQASLPYSFEGRQKYLKMLGEMTRLEIMFDERLIKIKTIPVPVKDRMNPQVEQAQDPTTHIIFGCFKGSS